MARYSRRTGPAADFELTGAVQDIPGMFITRRFDNGEILLFARARFLNNSAGRSTPNLLITIDGVRVSGIPPVVDLQPGELGALSELLIAPISAGIHTIALQAIGSANPGDIAQANGAILTVIQLPLWDQDTDLA